MSDCPKCAQAAASANHAWNELDKWRKQARRDRSNFLGIFGTIERVRAEIYDVEDGNADPADFFNEVKRIVDPPEPDDV
jgi:hypothetical protein